MGTSNNFAEAESSCTHIRIEANNIPFFLESRLLESREKGHEGNFYCLCALEIRASGRKGIFSQDLVALRASSGYRVLHTLFLKSIFCPKNPAWIFKSCGYFTVSLFFFENPPNMSQFNFRIFAFSNNFWPNKIDVSDCLVTLFDRKLQIFKNLSNWPC